MGNTSQLGIFDEDEVKHLSKPDLEKLQQHVSEQLRQATGDLVKTKPELFSKIAEVKEIVRGKSQAVLDNMPKS
jgi:hypothetical protein